MATWQWEGRTPSGELKQGVIEAENEREVHIKLKQKQISPDKVRKQLKPKIKIELSSGVSRQDLVVFVRQFATMIDAGLPLVQCLELIASQQANKKFKEILNDIKDHVAGGATFAQSLERHPKVFDTLFVNLVAAGEVGGILDTILNRLASYIENNAKLARQVKSAMAYPIGITAVAGIVIFVLLRFVIPSFEKMFANMGGDLPGLTKIVIGMSHWLAANTIPVFIGLGVFSYFLRR